MPEKVKNQGDRPHPGQNAITEKKNAHKYQ